METVFLKVALAAYLLGTVSFVVNVVRPQAGLRRLCPLLLLGGFAAHLAAILSRWHAAGYFAVTNFYEGLSLFACLTVGLYLLVQQRYHLTVLGAVVSPLAFVLTLAAFIFYRGVAELPQNLKSQWLFPLHITSAFLGNAVFALAFSTSLLYLVQESELKGKKRRGVFRHLPSLETLDELNYRALNWGFVLLTLGIVTGSLWAELSWGRFWSWEPRLVLSALTWTLYALLLHYRSVGWQGKRAARLTIFCFVILLVSYVTVNLFLPGRHGGEFG